MSLKTASTGPFMTSILTNSITLSVLHALKDSDFGQQQLPANLAIATLEKLTGLTAKTVLLTNQASPSNAWNVMKIKLSLKMTVQWMFTRFVTIFLLKTARNRIDRNVSGVNKDSTMMNIKESVSAATLMDAWSVNLIGLRR